MGRMAVVEEREGIASEEALPISKPQVDGQEPEEEPNTVKRIASRDEILNAFDAVSTLRYSEPIQLGGE